MRKSMDSNVIILLLTFSLAIVAFFSSKTDQKIRDEIKDNTNKLKDASGKIITDLTETGANIKQSQSEAETAYKKLNDTYNKLVETSESAQNTYNITLRNLEEIIAVKETTLKAQQETLNQLTGGNTYLSFELIQKTT